MWLESAVQFSLTHVSSTLWPQLSGQADNIQKAPPLLGRGRLAVTKTLRHSAIASSFVWPALRHAEPQVQQSPYTLQSASQRHVRRPAANSQEIVQLPQQSRFVGSRKSPKVLELAALATGTISLGGITCSMKLQKSSSTTVFINLLNQVYSAFSHRIIVCGPSHARTIYIHAHQHAWNSGWGDQVETC